MRTLRTLLKVAIGTSVCLGSTIVGSWLYGKVHDPKPKKIDSESK